MKKKKRNKRRLRNFMLATMLLLLLGFAGVWLKMMTHVSNGTAKDSIPHTSLPGLADVQNGDIIFQVSKSGQSKAIQEATDSKYSHMGIVYLNNGKAMVYEAVQPVKLTPLSEWIQRGKDGHYVIKRLENAEALLTPSTLDKMKAYGNRFLGKDYDLYFEWSDDKIYCSELVWKIYKEGAGVEIGACQNLGSFDLSGSAVQAKLTERYGGDIPMDEVVISPGAMFHSGNLKTVLEH